MKKRSLIILGMTILVLFMSLIVINKEVFFAGAYRDGETIIKFDVLNNNEIKVDRIEEIIIDNTGFEKNQIEIENSDKNLLTRFQFVEMEIIDKITNSITKEYEDELQLSGIHIIDQTKNPRGNFLLGIYPTLFLLLGILIPIVMGVVIFVSLRKILSHKELSGRINTLEEEVEKLKKKK